MPIKVQCPGCGKSLKAPDSAAGKNAKCPSCGQVVRLPESPAEQLEDPLIDLPEPAGSDAPRGSGAGPQPIREADDGAYDLAAPPAVPQPVSSGGDPNEPRRPCPMCGEMIPVAALKCRFCGEVFDPTLRKSGVPGKGGSGSVPTYLVQAILVTLCCCLPFGIASIVYAAQVNSKLSAGDYNGAVEASNNAKKYAWIAFICGLIANGFWLTVNILGAAGEM